MIHSARIFRFKGIALQEIGFEPLTVLVGANGTGKSSVLEAVYLAIQACSDNMGAFEDELSIEQVVSHGHHDTSVHCDCDLGTFATLLRPAPTRQESDWYQRPA